MAKRDTQPTAAERQDASPAEQQAMMERNLTAPFDEPKVTTEESPVAGAEKVRIETAPGVFTEHTVVERREGVPPMAAQPTAPGVDVARAPLPEELAAQRPRETIAAEPPTTAILGGRRPVTREELEAPAVRAASGSAQANLDICLLRAGDRVTQAVDCFDIFHPDTIIGLQAGAVVPDGLTLIPANLVNEALLGQPTR